MIMFFHLVLDGPATHDKHGIAVMQPNYTVTDYIVDSSWLAITTFVLLALGFASTTFYYWRKSRRMAKTLLQEHEETNNDTANNDEGDSNEEGKLRKNFENCSDHLKIKSSLVRGKCRLEIAL